MWACAHWLRNHVNNNTPSLNINVDLNIHKVYSWHAKQMEKHTVYDLIFTQNELRNLMENPVRSSRYYARIKRSLRKFVKFSFKNTKHFSPAQKSAITRAWNVYGGFVRDEVIGHKFKVIKVSRSQRKQLKHRYPISNIGLIISSDTGIPKIPGKVQLPALIKQLINRANRLRKKKGMSEQDSENLIKAHYHFETFPEFSKRWLVVTRKKSLLDIFFPLLQGERVDQLANAVITLLAPNSIHLAVNKSRGTTPYTPDTWEGYQSTLVYLDKKIKRETDVDPFKGVHATWIIFKKKR